MSEINPVVIILSAISVAAASGLIGSFLVLRKMTLVSDSLSHVALPGIALGLLFHFSPLAGGIGFLVSAMILIWGVQWKTSLSFDSVIGVFFVASLALGSLLIPHENILEAFFGDITTITTLQAILQTIIAFGVLITVTVVFKKLALVAVAPDLAYSVRTSQQTMDFLFLILVALTITIGISFVGVLLMSSLLIIPAVTARNVARTFRSYIALSIGTSIVSLGGGLILASVAPAIEPGIATVLTGTVLFVGSLLWNGYVSQQKQLKVKNSVQHD